MIEHLILLIFPEYCTVIGLIISGFTLWQVGSIRKNQKEMERNLIFNRRMENQLFLLKDINAMFKDSISDSNEQDIKAALSEIQTQLEIIRDMIPGKYKVHHDYCKGLIKRVKKQYKCQYQTGVRQTSSLRNLLWGCNIISYGELLNSAHEIQSLTTKLFIVLETKDIIS